MIRKFEVLKEGRPDILPDWAQWSQFPALSQIRDFKTLEGETVFDVIYNLDDKTLRTVPKNNKLNMSEHFFLAGCSMVFGVGVMDDQTLAAQLKYQRPDLDVINFAFAGGGPHNLLRSLDFISLNELSNVPRGHFYYFFINDHINRWFATPSYLQWVPYDFAHYQVKKGKLEYKGSIKSQSFYQEFSRMRKLGLEHSYIKMNGQETWGDDKIMEFMVGVNELKQKYLTHFPDGKFTFVFYPIFSNDLKLYDALIRVATKLNIDIVDFSAQFTDFIKAKNMTHESLLIPHDFHPTPLMNSVLAEWLGKFEP